VCGLALTGSALLHEAGSAVQRPVTSWLKRHDRNSLTPIAYPLETSAVRYRTFFSLAIVAALFAAAGIVFPASLGKKCLLQDAERPFLVAVSTWGHFSLFKNSLHLPFTVPGPEYNDVSPQKLMLAARCSRRESKRLTEKLAVASGLRILVILRVVRPKVLGGRSHQRNCPARDSPMLTHKLDLKRGLVKKTYSDSQFGSIPLITRSQGKAFD